MQINNLFWRAFLSYLSSACAMSLLLCSFSSAAFSESCLQPMSGNCEFYRDCLEARVSCGSTGYALGYGGRYCEKFTNEARFSPQGQNWRDITRLCLQRSLVRFVDPEAKQSECTEIMDVAFDSHPFCYTQSEGSICNLPIRDVQLIFNMIEPQDKFSGRGIKQMTRVAQTCIFHIQNQLAVVKFSSQLNTQNRWSMRADRSHSASDVLADYQSELEEKLQLWESLASEAAL
jgi:hypothetical protein